jgi:hypothetical protein
MVAIIVFGKATAAFWNKDKRKNKFTTLAQNALI